MENREETLGSAHLVYLVRGAENPFTTDKTARGHVNGKSRAYRRELS